MKAKRVIKVVVDTYAEEQFILNRFPESYWVDTGSKIIFYIDTKNENAVYNAIIEWHEMNKERN